MKGILFNIIMKILKTIIAFDERLKQKAMKIEIFDENLKSFAQDMLYTTQHSNAVGLSSIQVEDDTRFNYKELMPGYRAQGNLICVSYLETTLLLANIEILEFSQEKEIDFEGCVSVPKLQEKIERSKEIKIKFQDLDGNEHIQTFSGFIARIIQHEVDHSNGILFPERLKGFQKIMAWKKYNQQKQFIR